MHTAFCVLVRLRAMKIRVLFPVALAFVCGVGGYVWGQNEPSEIYHKAIESSADLELKGYDGAHSATGIYQVAGQSPKETSGIVEEALVDAYSDKKKTEALFAQTAEEMT